MSLVNLMEKVFEKFPNLPKPKIWEDHGKKRFYFNKKESDQDYTFFIDVTNLSSLKLGQKPNSLWHPSYPNKQELIHFINQFHIKQEGNDFIVQDGVLSEFYSINPEKLGNLYCYGLELLAGTLKAVGGKLGYQLRKRLSGFWNFSDNFLLTNYYIEEDRLSQILKDLWSKDPITYGNLTKIKFLKDKTPSARSIADFTANFLSFRYNNDINGVLDKYRTREAKINIKKDCIIRGWVINNIPSISFSIKSNIYYDETFEKFLKTLNNFEVLINFPVIDTELRHVGKITELVGPLKDHRDRLLSLTSRDTIKQKILKAPDEEEVFVIDGTYHYPASTLYPLVTTKNAHHFEANTAKLMSHLTLAPETRNTIEMEIISHFKDYLLNNFNSESTKELFKKGEDIGFKNQLKFKDGSIHSEEEYVLKNLREHGIYKKAPKFEEDPTIKVVLLLGALADQFQVFWEQLKDELNKLGFTPILLRVIKLDKITPIEIEQKTKSITNDECDIIVAILPENPNQDKIYEMVKSNLFNSNLNKSQFIFDNTIRDKLKWAISNVILGILAKTENIPYVLAHPLNFTDYLVGIDISREKKKTLKGSQNFAATARFYGKDGTFSHYEIHEDKIEGETLPTTILERIFAKSMFQGKTIMIHRDGFFRGEEISFLKKLGEKYNIKFKFVEVIKRNVPRLFNAKNGQYFNPDKNQIFYLSSKEAIIINNEVKGSKTANPLRIRVCDDETNLDNAIISVMALRMVHFGSTKAPKLPVTISFSDRISGFVRRGIKPPNKSGNIPWWY